MSPQILSAEQAAARDLIPLYHRLHALSVRFAYELLPSEQVVRELIELLDEVAPVMAALNRVVPEVLQILSQVDKVHDVTMLTGELTEAHRLLGHSLRDHDVDPGLPPMPVGELLRRSVLLDGNGKPLPITLGPGAS